jgi:hypothetical protein
MSYTIELDKCHKVMKRLARELKTKYNVGDNEIIWPYITQDYGIRVKYKNYLDPDPGAKTLVTFPSESFYTFLLLKYS